MSDIWMVGSIAMLLPLGLAMIAIMRGAVPRRLAAVQTMSTIAVLELAMASFAFDQPATIDLALALALLSLPAALLYALFHERWL